MHFDFVVRHTRHFGCSGPCQAGHLSGCPNFQLPVFELRRAIHGLHGGVRQIRGRVLRLNDARSTCFSFHGIALLIKRETAFCFEFVLQFCCNALGIDGAFFALRPLGFDLLCGLLGMPRRFGNHRKAWCRARSAGKLNAFNNARHGQRFFDVDAAERATHLRHLHDAGKQHVGHAHIDAKYGTAICFGRHVCARCGLTNQAPIFAIFQNDMARRLACSTFGKFTIVRRLAGSMTDHAIFHAQFFGRHFPLICSRQQQTGFGSSRCSPQVVPSIFDRR